MHQHNEASTDGEAREPHHRSMRPFHGFTLPLIPGPSPRGERGEARKRRIKGQTRPESFQGIDATLLASPTPLRVSLTTPPTGDPVTQSPTTASHGGHDLGFWLLTLNVRYKENVGGLIRVASNFGASGVVLVGQGSYRRAAALGLGKSVPLLRLETPERALEWLARERIFLVAAERTEKSTPIHRAEWPSSRLCFAVGSERDGLPATLLERADQLVDIPMYGQSASMNLFVSAGVLSYEHVRRLGFPPRPDLNASGRVSGWKPRIP